MKLLLIQRGGIYIEELVKNIILSIVTGIISGVIVTVYYRKKDAKKEKLKYLYDLRDYMYKLIAETIPLGLVYPEQIEKAHEKLKKEGMFKAPMKYDWYKFTKGEQKVLDEFEVINRNICTNYLKIIDCQFRSKGTDLQKSDVMKFLDEKSKAHDKLSKYWGMLSPEFMLKIENLIINYAKKK